VHPSQRASPEAELSLYFVDSSGALRRVETDALNSEAPDVARFPYGAVVLPRADRDGSAVVVITQPGASGRHDVLVVEKPIGIALQASNAIVWLMPILNEPLAFVQSVPLVPRHLPSF
jgi:hypothetical protein